MSHRRGHRRRPQAIRLLAAVATIVSALVAMAGPAAAETTIDAEVGYGGYTQPGGPYPVRIELTADELFVGDLRIVDRSGAPVLRTQPVEIPAGTTREIIVVLEGSPWDVGAPQIELLADGDFVATRTVRGRTVPGELVGVLPVLADRGLPETAPVATDAGEAVLHRLDPADLALGWGMLGPLDIVVATAADLTDLDEPALDSLLAWVNQGGRLLVDEPSGSPVPGLPAAWQPDGSTPTAAGLGEIVLTDGNAAAGNWDLVFEPAPTRSRQEDEVFGEITPFWGGEPLSWGLGTDAGFALPSLRWLIAILAGYVLVAGPLLWFVLRRVRRPGLAWIGVPAISLVFTASIWVLGAGVRSSTEVAHGTIVEVGPRGSTATTYTLLHAKTGGVEHLTLPTGWHVSTSFSEGIGVQLDVESEADGLDVAVELDAGGFAVVGGSGTTTALDDAVTVTAESPESGRVTGTVTNNLAVDLHDVAVFADQAGTNIGTIAAGATVEYDLDGLPAAARNGQPVEWSVWPNAVDPRFGFAEVGVGVTPEFEPGPINMGLWNELNTQWSLNDRAIGRVVVAGWTDELPSPIDADVDAGRTLVFTRVGIEPAGDTVTDLSVARTLVRGPSALGAKFRLDDAWGGGAALRYVLPDGIDDDLVLEVTAGQRRVELWADDQWRPLDIEPRTHAVVALPASAIVDRRVYVRVLLDFERGIPEWRALGVRSADPSDEVEPVVWLDESAGDAADAADAEPGAAPGSAAGTTEEAAG